MSFKFPDGPQFSSESRLRPDCFNGSPRDIVQVYDNPDDPWMKLILESREHLDVVTERKKPLEDKISAGCRIVEICDLIPRSSRIFVRGLNNQAILYRELGRASKAFELLDRARKFVLHSKQLFTDDERQIWLSTIRNTEGTVHQFQGFYREAEVVFRDAWRQRRDYFMPLYNLFEVCVETLNRQKAEFWCEVMETYPDDFRKVRNEVKGYLELLRVYENERIVSTEGVSGSLRSNGPVTGPLNSGKNHYPSRPGS